MTFSRTGPWIGFVFRLVLAAVLGYAGLVKLFEDEGAKRAILAYRVFPVEWASFLGYAMPTLELVLALLLLIGLFTRWAAAITGLLMLAFIAGIIGVWVRGYSIDCGCFGGGGDVTPEGINQRYLIEIIRDLVFALMAGFLVLWPRTRIALESPRASDAWDAEGKDFESDEGFADDDVTSAS